MASIVLPLFFDISGRFDFFHEKVTNGSICEFPTITGLFAEAAHDELVAVLGVNAIAYSKITEYLAPPVHRDFLRTFRSPLSMMQFLTSLTNNDSLVFGAWRSSFTVQRPPSIDTSQDHSGLS
jgi:hypothetical protein